MMEKSIRPYRVAERDPGSFSIAIELPGWKDPVAAPKKTTP